jgi:hypothetical protein
VDHSAVLYVAESPEHAIAELLQPWRNRPLRSAHLLRGGRPLALVSIEVKGSAGGDLLDLCDPHALVSIDTGPDRVASRDRARTQRIARRAWDDGRTGVRWWSVFGGDWHGVALFESRLRGWIEFGSPEPLSRDSIPLRAAAGALGMEV